MPDKTMTTASVTPTPDNEDAPGMSHVGILRAARGAQESAVVLMLVTLLFVGFVFLQLGYLFGGSAVIEARSGLTVAQYARRGFIELTVVAALTLALLLALAATPCSRSLLRRLGTLLTACVLIILASAVQRLWLYVQSFGLTLDRLVALAVLLWLGLNLLTFAATALRERPAGFASGAAFSAIATVLLLGLVNPAAIVVNVNTTRAAMAAQDQTTTSLDVAYLLQLGADAIPPLLARFDDLPRPAQCEVALTLLQQWYPAPTVNAINDWRDWNASRATAQRLVAEQGEQGTEQVFIRRTTSPASYRVACSPLPRSTLLRPRECGWRLR